MNNNNNNNKVSSNNTNRKRTNDIEIEENITFSELVLQKEVLRGLEEAGYQRPSPIQLKAIPLGISGVDIIAQAKSGTGKTVVFGVIALECVLRESRLLKEKQDQKSKQTTQKELLEMDDDSYCESVAGVVRKPLVLIMAPTREIAIQIKEVITVIGKYCKRVKCQVFIGGLNQYKEQDNDLNKLNGAQIIVGTPGRIKSLIENLHLRTDTLKMLILDEADKLMDASFSKTVNWIYTTLPSSIEDNRQTLAFSATYPGYLIKLLNAYMKNPLEIRLCSDTPALEGIKQYYQVFKSTARSLVGNQGEDYGIFKEKIESALLILEQVSFYQAIIFCNHKVRAEELTRYLNDQGWPSSFIAGGQDQKDRSATMTALKSFNIRILVSTDLISRGIDVERVNLVINLDLPKDHETYFHRIGRTGRFGTFGVSITFITFNEKLNQLQNKLKLKQQQDSDNGNGGGGSDKNGQIIDDNIIVEDIDFINQLIQEYNVDITQRKDNDFIPEELYSYQLSNSNDQKSLDNLKLKQQHQILLNQQQIEENESHKDEDNQKEEEEEEEENDDDDDIYSSNSNNQDYQFIDENIIDINKAMHTLKLDNNNNNNSNNKNKKTKTKKLKKNIDNNNYNNQNQYQYQNNYNNNNNNNYSQFQNLDNNIYNINNSQYQYQNYNDNYNNFNNYNNQYQNSYSYNIPNPEQYQLNQFYYCQCPNCPNMNFHYF